MITYKKAGAEQLEDAVKIRVEMLSLMHGAYDGERAVGCATLCYITVMPTFDHPTGKRANLMNVYTNADYRRRGIARNMVMILLDEAKEKGVTYISLDTTQSGEPLYNALDFDHSKETMGLNLTRC